MEPNNNDPIQELIIDMDTRLKFDASRFSFDEFENLSDELDKLREIETPITNNLLNNEKKNTNKEELANSIKEHQQLEQHEISGQLDEVMGLKAFNLNENIKREIKDKKELYIVVKGQKKPKKGILKPSSPPGTFAKRSSLLLRQQSTKLLNKFLPFNRNSFYGDYISTNSQELNPKQLKRVRFSVPLRSTSYIIPTSCKLVPSEDNFMERFNGIEGPNLKNKGRNYSAKDILDWYISICNSREELPNNRFLQILEEATKTNQVIESLILNGQSFPDKHILPISDVFELFSNLIRLELEDCNLNDESIKILVSNLLVIDKIRWFNLSNNPNIGIEGFRYIATYINQSKQLKSLDLSGNLINFQSAKFLALGMMISTKDKFKDSINNNDNNELYLKPLETPTSPSFMNLNNNDDNLNHYKCSLEDLKLNECGIKSLELKVLSQAIAKSNIKSLSLCGNNLNVSSGAYLATILSGTEDLNEKNSSSSLVILDLSRNSLKTEGITYLLGPLSNPNSQLEELKLNHNLINETGMIRLFNSLKTNKKLHHLDLSANSVCGPSIEGLWSTKACFSQNNSLKSLFLSDTNMTSEGAIALAEVLPETRSLTRLDISVNPGITLAGLLALSVSAKLNYSITCLEVSIPPNCPEMSVLAQDMLTTCARNTQLVDDLSFHK